MQALEADVLDTFSRFDKLGHAMDALLAQAGGLSTMLRIRVLANHELLDGDWKEEEASKARHRQARR